MHPAGVLAIILWILIAAAIVLAMFRLLIDGQSKAMQERAFKEVVEERGFKQKPGESVRQFVRRAQRQESRRPSPLPRSFAQPPLPRIRDEGGERRR